MCMQISAKQKNVKESLNRKKRMKNIYNLLRMLSFNYHLWTIEFNVKKMNKNKNDENLMRITMTCNIIIIEYETQKIEKPKTKNRNKSNEKKD